MRGTMHNFILQSKLGSTTLRNYIGDLKEFEIEFYNNDLPIIVPFRTPWGRFVSGQVQDFMDLIVEDNDIYAIGADDSKIHILSINKKESKYLGYSGNGKQVRDILHIKDLT